MEEFHILAIWRVQGSDGSQAGSGAAPTRCFVLPGGHLNGDGKGVWKRDVRAGYRGDRAQVFSHLLAISHPLLKGV